MKRVCLLLIAITLLATATIAAADTQPKVLPVSASATTTLLLQQGQAAYAGTEDAYIDRWTPNQNWGGNGWLMVTASEDRSGLIRFDLADYLPRGSTVTAATLELYAASRTRALSEQVGAYRVLRDWVELEANWTRAMIGGPWGAPGCNASTDRDLVAADTLTVSQVDRWYRFIITDMVQDWVNDPSSNHGLLVKGINEGQPIEYMFYTSESGQALRRPILRVDYAAGVPPAPDVCRASFNPAAKVAYPSGGAFTVDVDLQGVTDLGGFQFAFAFDPRIVSVQNVALGSLVTGSGRAFTALGPQIDNGAGSASFGAFSYGSGSGRNGSGSIASITFSPVTLGTSALRFESIQLVTTGGAAIPTTVENGSIAVQVGLVGDVNNDCDVDILDIMLVAGRWGATRGTARYDALYDLNGDGVIDIADIMLVVAHWGERCSG